MNIENNQGITMFFVVFDLVIMVVLGVMVARILEHVYFIA